MYCDRDMPDPGLGCQIIHVYGHGNRDQTCFIYAGIYYWLDEMTRCQGQQIGVPVTWLPPYVSFLSFVSFVFLYIRALVPPIAFSSDTRND